MTEIGFGDRDRQIFVEQMSVMTAVMYIAYQMQCKSWRQLLPQEFNNFLALIPNFAKWLFLASSFDMI